MLYDNLPSLQRYQFLMAQPNWGVGTFVRGRNYEITCGTGLPMFTTTDPDPGCVEGIESNDRALWDLTQNIVEANLQGKIADMRNGELRFATGVAMRENKFRYDPGTNNDNVAVVEQPLGIFLGNNTAGSTDVSELYGELLIPTTERLDIELGYRYSDYDTAGGVNTYKTLFDFSATESVRLRGGYQFATRAPNTEELFAGPRLQTVTDFIYGDPCQASTTATWGNIASQPGSLGRAEPLPSDHRQQHLAVRPEQRFHLRPAGPRRLRASRPAVLPNRERSAAGQSDVSASKKRRPGPSARCSPRRAASRT